MNKKVLGIKASGRINSNTEIILNELLRASKEKGYDTEIVSLIKYDLKSCTGCFGCNNSELKCVIKDDLEAIKEKIDGADAIALASPCMAIGAPSVLKTVMDRAAAWAFEKIAGRTGISKSKFGAAVLVGGAEAPFWSLERILPAEFLQLFNCRTVGMFTIGDTGLKGEILLSPSKIQRIRGLGEHLADSLETGVLHPYSYSEIPGRLVCPICFSDTFHVDSSGHYLCAVCSTPMHKYIPLEKALKANDRISEDNIFSKKMAEYHTDFIGNKISRMMNASEEVNDRIKQYFDLDIIKKEDFIPDTLQNESTTIQVTWDEEGLKIFEKTVPAAFKKFVKKAVEKKAAQRGIMVITKEIFLQIKKESGN